MVSAILFGWFGDFGKTGATSEYPATHALLKSTATMVRGPQTASKVICIKLSVKLKCYRGQQSREVLLWSAVP